VGGEEGRGEAKGGEREIVCVRAYERVYVREEIVCVRAYERVYV